MGASEPGGESRRDALRSVSSQDGPAPSGARNVLLPWASPTAQPGGEPHRSARPGFITPEGRDLRIDILRGYCVVAMVLDHIGGASPVQLLLSGGNRFFTSPAEGFILISGLMAGLSYRRVIARDGVAAAVRKVLARAAELYLLTIGMTLVLLPVSEALGLPWAQGIELSRSLRLVIAVLSLQQTYYLVDVMLLFTLLFLCSPLALALLARGKTRVLLAGSWLLWGVYQFFPREILLPWPIAGNLVFNFAPWQVLFFTAMALGYQRDRMKALTERGARKLQLVTGGALIALVVLYVILYGSQSLPAYQMPGPLAALASRLAAVRPASGWIEEYLFAKAELRPGRLLASAVVFTFMFLTLTRQWRRLGRPLDWLTGLLGRHALYAFTVHTGLALVVGLALLPYGPAATERPWLSALLQIGAIVVVWLMTRLRVLHPTAETHLLWRASPAALALLAILVMPWLPVHRASVDALTVPDEILARARAYGTPMTSQHPGGVPRSEERPYPARGETEPPTGTPVPLTAQPVTLAQVALQPSSPGPTPMPATAEASALPDGAGLPAGSSTAHPPASGRSKKTPDGAPLASPLPATVTAATPVPKPTALLGINAEPILPLPSGESRLVTRWVGPIAGHAYSLTLRSELVQRTVPIWVYLPPDYGKTSRRYPTLYMLHGGSGKMEEWAAYGLFDMADKAFSAGRLPPFIIVLPTGETGFWANQAGGGTRWGDYLAYEVVGRVDSQFATIRSPLARGVGGLSMGGWGALYQGFLNPYVFGVVMASSPPFYPDHDYLWFVGSDAEYASKDPLTVAQTITVAPYLRLWLDVGEEDPWAPPVIQLHRNLLQRGIAHDFHQYKGMHQGGYWAEHIPDYLQWFSANLAQDDRRQNQAR